MPIRPILRFPAPGLRRPAAAITKFDEELRALAVDLLDTMRAAPGIGVTAPHIGVELRLFVLDLPGEAGPEYYVNPTILWSSSEMARHDEGSVSMPGVSAEVERPTQVRVHFQDLSGAEATLDADGLRAVCIQHEMDQLNGVFWLQRLSRLKRDRAVKRFEKLERAS